MKNPSRYLLILITASVIFYLNCDDKSNPLSFVDDYTVTLTEAEGTTYTGNYFPLENSWDSYSGSISMKTRTEIPGSEPIEELIDESIWEDIRILAPCNIPLSSGIVSLYPISEFNFLIHGYSDTTRFFMKDAQAVYLKAFKLSKGVYLEVDNPLYIKSELVVGDSWETAPRLDMTKLLARELYKYRFGMLTVTQSNIDLTAQAKFFVVGNEPISLPGGTRDALRLEQASEITMTGDMIIDILNLDIYITARLASVYHLIPDTGIVHQSVTGHLEMKVSAGGEKITIDINQYELTLDGFYKVAYSYSSNNLKKRTRQPPTFNSPCQEKLWKVSQAITQILLKNLSL
ncbi:MAG: hypothetical protein P8078_04530 [bacterium]